MATPVKADPRDPRYRNFRIAAYVVYMLVAVGFSTFIIVNVVRSVVAMSPGHRKETGKVMSAGECLAQAQALWDDLEAHRKLLAEAKPATKADDTWPAFRVKWMNRHRDVEAVCIDGRPALKDVYSRLDKLMDLYTTNTVQYAGETGPTIDRFREAIELAKKEAK